jgi:cell division protein FtsN
VISPTFEGFSGMSEASQENSMSSAYWLFTGIVTGLFVAFLYYLSGIPVPASHDAAEDSPKQVYTPRPTPAPGNTASTRPNTTGGQQNNPRTIQNDAPPASKAPPAKTPAIEKQSGFIIQAGSFRLVEDAQRRRSELLLLGLSAQVTTVTLPNQLTLHRVQIGPFTSKPSLDQAQRTLAENQIEHLVLESD